jgi:SNF2 family DNA or RNA helicase
MVKIYQTASDAAKGKFSVEFASKHYYYAIIAKIKQYPFDKMGRTWLLNVSDLKKVIVDIATIKLESVHVDLSIFQGYFADRESKAELLELRETLDGMDSGVKLDYSQLLPFQHIGVIYMDTVKNGIIADRVGLGKTIQALGCIRKWTDDDRIDKAIVVATSSIADKWRGDALKFISDDALILRGTKDKREGMFKEFADSDKPLILIVSYDTLRNDWKNYMSDSITFRFAVVCDEIQKLKNTSSKRSKAVKALTSHPLCHNKLGLSATYIETSMNDLFGTMLVIDDSAFGTSYTSFAARFLHMDSYGIVRGHKNTAEAHKIMSLRSVRRTKPMVKDQLDAMLPEVNENTLWVELSAEEKAMYNDIVDKVVDRISDMERAEKVSLQTLLTQTTLLRQACLSTDMFGFEPSVSTKMETLMETIPDIVTDDKVVVFCHFKKFIDLMEERLHSEGYKTIAMHGGRPEGLPKNRQPLVDKFQESSDINILLTSDILAEGVDIPGAGYIINTDILWNPAKITQRNGRIDRLNQMRRVIYVINILTNRTIEQEMHKRLYDRYQMGLEVMDGGVEETRIKKITYSDVRKMLRKVL